MPNIKAELLNQIDALLKRYEEVKTQFQQGDFDAATEIAISMAAALKRLAPEGSSYRTAAKNAAEKHGSNYMRQLSILPAALKALRDDCAAGYLTSVEELIHADLFTDFLEMATHLLEENYKDAAAVMIGGVLEEQIRKLCNKSGIPITFVNPKGEVRPKKLDTMNSDLVKQSVYNTTTQKEVTAWAGLRNFAAHAEYTKYAREQVDLMLQGVRNFIARFPA